MKAGVRWVPSLVVAFLPGVVLTMLRARKLSVRLDAPYFSAETWTAVAPLAVVMLLVGVAIFVLMLRDR